MAIKYNFSLGFHGDMILNSREEHFNMGYNYISKFHFVPWLYNLQVSGKNIFNELRIAVGAEKTLDKELDELVISIILLSHKLPLSPKIFNLELDIQRIRDFYAGDNRTLYSWQLTQDHSLCLSLQDKRILQLSLEENDILILDYLDFLDKEEMLELPKSNVQEIIRRLKSA